MADFGFQWLPSQNLHIRKPVAAGWLKTAVRKSRV
jgi:hypothetical protein